MCAVSVISAYGRDNVPLNAWTQDSYSKFQETLNRARDFDEAANQPHCEEEEKSAWMRDVEARLERMEQASRIPG